MYGVGSQRDQGFYLLGQLLNMFGRFLQRIVVRLSLPCGKDWDGIHNFDFTGCTLLAVVYDEDSIWVLGLACCLNQCGLRERKGKVKEESRATDVCKFGA